MRFTICRTSSFVDHQNQVKKSRHYLNIMPKMEIIHMANGFHFFVRKFFYSGDSAGAWLVPRILSSEREFFLYLYKSFPMIITNIHWVMASWLEGWWYRQWFCVAYQTFVKYEIHFVNTCLCAKEEKEILYIPSSLHLTLNLSHKNHLEGSWEQWPPV